LGLVDYAISRTRRIPFVYNLQDLFPEAAVRLGVLTNPRVIRGFERLERFVYRKADRLSVISEGFRRYLLDRGVPDEKITVVPNYTDTEFITPLSQTGNRYRTAHGLDGKFVVQFSGRMGYSQGLGTVVEAWRQLDDLDDLRLMMVGDGAERPMITRELGHDPRVTILPTQPREHLPDLLAASDVGLAPLRHGMAGTSVPSKIFGILAAGRPVVAGVDVDSDTDEMITEADCGLVVTPEDPTALANALRRLYADRARARKMGKNGRAHVARFHTQEVVVDQYERMLLDVVGHA
jgi:colanic acid biosynthesis glycosyl transferase WcaI